MAAWIASPPHLANILEARYTETGIGVTAGRPRPRRAEGAPGATYAQEFGVDHHRDPAPPFPPSPGSATLARPEKGGGPNVADSTCGTLEVTGR